MQNFAGSMFSTHIGQGAIGGSMMNEGDTSLGLPRGTLSPFDNLKPEHRNGTVQNLDDDPDLEIGAPAGAMSADGMIAGRTGPSNVPDYLGFAETAEYLLYRFTLPIDQLLARDLSNMTSVYFLPSSVRTHFIWFEDAVPKNGIIGNVRAADSVLIHAAQTPEELAMIPEPGTWTLGLLGILVGGLFIKRRRS